MRTLVQIPGLVPVEFKSGLYSRHTWSFSLAFVLSLNSSNASHLLPVHMARRLQGGGHGALGRVLVTGVHTLGDAVAGVVAGNALPRPAAPLKLAALPGLHHGRPAPQALQLAAVPLQSSEHESQTSQNM